MATVNKVKRRKASGVFAKKIETIKRMAEISFVLGSSL
jgi:hypothetical protein